MLTLTEVHHKTSSVGGWEGGFDFVPSLPSVVPTTFCAKYNAYCKIWIDVCFWEIVYPPLRKFVWEIVGKMVMTLFREKKTVNLSYLGVKGIKGLRNSISLYLLSCFCSFIANNFFSYILPLCCPSCYPILIRLFGEMDKRVFCIFIGGITDRYQKGDTEKSILLY